MAFFGWHVISTDKIEHLVARINRFGLLADYWQTSRQPAVSSWLEWFRGSRRRAVIASRSGQAKEWARQGSNL